MRKISVVMAAVALYFTAFNVNAANQWYVGKVARIALLQNDGSFIVTFKNSALDDCEYKYAHFFVNSLGADQVKNAYAMALTSLTTGVDMGIVIDKNGIGEQCDATGMTADLRAN
ncbi:MAG: hypothetical protein KZQ85_10935 [Candidatus Thiodiazotropha sp. (ex Myrtea sp. 'scaly one' KF741663)]|nr:hypothetical protein [Candidatus Thiodiazotropha sp. (ex Myrtea sp. 'scaly one' KF741663)]